MYGTVRGKWWWRVVGTLGLVSVIAVGLLAPLYGGGDRKLVLLRVGGGICAEGTVEELDALQELARQNAEVVRLTFRSEGSATIEGMAGRCARYVCEMCGDMVEGVEIKAQEIARWRGVSGEEKLIEGQREGIRHYG